MSKINHITVVVCLVCLLLPIFFGACITKGKQSIVNNQRDSSQNQQIIPATKDTTCLSIDSLNNALICDEELGWIRLKHGRYSRHVNDLLSFDTYYVGDFTFADLNNDGYKDAIGMISANTGGSGCYISMVVFVNKKGSPLFADSYFIGDREGIDSIKIVGRQLDVFFLKHGPNDGMAKATLRVEKKFEFIKNKLVELK
jgi:hypothetical protein